jgi:lysophospholipase L1-like esterase
MLNDGIHPDAKGVRRIAEIVAEAMKANANP